MSDFHVSVCVNDEKYGDIVIEAEGTVSTYRPATMYKRNGDPGDPEEGGEVEITLSSAYLDDGESNATIPDFDCDQYLEEIEEAAREYVAENSGPDCDDGEE